MTSSALPELAVEPRLFFQALNPTGNETVVLIHGGFGCNKEWNNVTPPLIENGYHVLLPDLPAHGKSAAIQPFTVDYAAQLILELIAKHGRNGSAHIVGLSIGAHVAACVAERGGPDHVLSVIASGYNVFQPPRLIVPLFAPTVFLLLHLLNAATDPKAEVATWQNGESSYALIQEVTKTILQPREIGDIHVRLLAVASASNDTWISKDRPGSSERLLEAVVGRRENGSRAVMHHGIRHNWHVEKPALFAALVISWIRDEQLDTEFKDIE